MALAVRAMKAGAVDFLEKPFAAETIFASLGGALSWLAVPSERKPAALAGLPNKSIAYDLEISPRTVEMYRARDRQNGGAQPVRTDSPGSGGRHATANVAG
jgi:two-component system response regulator FixJ